jgi:hypothetical protein
MNKHIKKTLKVISDPKVGEKVLVEFSIENTSDKDILFLKWNTPFEEIQGNIFKVLKSKHYRLPYHGKHVKRGRPEEKDYILIKKGETIKTTLDISEAYHFNKEGDYEIAIDTYGMDFMQLESEDTPFPKDMKSKHGSNIFKLTTEKKPFRVEKA